MTVDGITRRSALAAVASGGLLPTQASGGRADDCDDRVTMDVNERDLRGDVVPRADLTIDVPEPVLESVRERVRDRFSDVDGDAWEYAKAEHPRVVIDHVDERISWAFANDDLPDDW